MKKLFYQLINNEVILYLIAGVAATLVYMITRMGLFLFIPSILLVTLLANAVAILFAFWTNDRFVFKQVREGWFQRLIKFTTARIVTLVLDMALAYILVAAYPQFIGQFVHNNINLVNAIATLFSQVLVIVLNYVLSKLFVFKDKK
ncbi:GtrA family protein [Streptococcus suis]|uniref:GtrA family protein n=1 Tax=Streptococcus suis TaxID=1307 RepID=UPI000CF37BF7|nr:GtrA family protein [Streptococcus suis]HEM4974646.1 GtrA family protein [Streptococcus suis]HEM5057001.1 GtrA family protein [Streptococcus suis]HEM5067384.1 GtrA family protein [Streptococcus suis]HEM5164177.1 GtrA family protein [Streptococcus suis]HEM5288273.1 GtrA family protein [Streptococcus suis]